MKEKQRICVSIWIGLLMSSLTLQAQDSLEITRLRSFPKTDQQHRSYWLDLGLGLNSLGGSAFMVHLHGQLPNQWLLTAGLTIDFSERLLVASYKDEKINVNSFHVLGGKMLKTNATVLTLSTGLGLVEINTESTYPVAGLFPTERNTHRYTIGVPILAQAYLVAFRSVGLGLNLVLNLNTIRPTANLQLSLALGRLTPRRGSL